MKTKHFILLISLLLGIKLSHAQFYVSGQDRGSIRWMQIKTDNFRVVFPDYAEEQAQKVAFHLSQCLPVLSEDIQRQAKSIDIIMHMESATSNGMVVWAPKRMEIYNTPSQDIEAHNWWGHLMLHEYRHVLQIDKLNQGFTKALTYLLGQQATGSVIGLYMPMWYIEGDAVVSETKYSSAGRGRNPDFHRPLRAQLQDIGKYSYDKAYFGSYKDYTPNYYVLGYHMVMEANKLYGDDFWNQHVDYVARHSYAVAPFGISLKRSSGQWKTDIYSSAMDSLRQRWLRDSTLHSDSLSITIAHKPSRLYTDYRFVHALNDSLYFALKRVHGELYRFVSITPSGKEKRLHTPGFSDFYALSVKQNKVVWSERRYHTRWDHVKYNNIMIMDLDKRIPRAIQLTHYQRLFAPDLSNDASRIVCSEVSKENNYALVVLDTDKGTILKRITFPSFVAMPVWSPNDDYIYYLQLIPGKGKALMKIHLETESISEVLPPQFSYIKRIAFWKQNLLIEAAFNGVVNAYQVNEEEQSLKPLTDVAFGLDGVSQSHAGDLLFSDYTAMGYRPVYQKLPLNHAFIPIEDIQPVVSYKAKRFDSDSLFNAQDHIPDTARFAVKKYRKITHLFNPHSWGPVAINANSQTALPGFQLTSQNLLGTSVLTGGYEYDLNAASGRYFVDYSYLGWYPELKLSMDRRERTGRLLHANGDTSSFPYYQDGAHLKMSLPFKLNRGKFWQQISVSGQLSYLATRAVESTPPEFNENEYLFSSFYFSAYRLLRRSNKDVSYRRGFSLDYIYRSTHGNSLSYLSAWNATVYFPGLWKHHGIRVYAGYQRYAYDQLSFTNAIRTPRGFAAYNDKYMQSLQLDYRLPICYPDLHIGPVVYIKRIKGGIMADYALADVSAAESTLRRSYSAELTMDGHFFRFIAPIEFGARYSRLNDENNPFFVQLLFNFDFSF